MNFVIKHYENFIKKNGYISEIFNAYNESEIKDIAPTQTSQCGSTGSSASVLIKEDKMNSLRVRRLTPKECWRLMGFDDFDYEKAAEVNSNTQLYKQAGNSIVVNVLEAVFTNLLLEPISANVVSNSNSVDIHKIEVPQTVKVRKYDVDIVGLQKLLREHKIATNKEIADYLGVPQTMVEHWFRTDKYFNIPDPDVWYRLKDYLHITTNEFDESIMTFEEREGVFESANRYYFDTGIAPTLTESISNEKIVTGGDSSE